MEQEIMTTVEAQTSHTTVSLEPSSSLFTLPNRPVSLMFHDLNYKIKSKKHGLVRKRNSKSEEKLILKGISGVVHPGEILVMLGPSGCGKTTLLTALGGRLDGTGKLVGTITYNGKPFSKMMKRNIGFVTQDDILLPHLTVKETLVFTALLRLTNNLTKQEKIMKVESVISQLGLVECKNRVVGSQKIRGVSGGERKRVSIGQEILINPSLLLLDEPTSGLDSTTAQRIMSILSELGNRGTTTIVMTIHQPSSRLFYMFHKILLLSEGNMIYFGKGSQVMDYFSSIGYSPPTIMNPSDYLLDLANGVLGESSNEQPIMVKQNLISSFKKINLFHQLESEIQQYSYNDESSLSNGQWSTTWWQQFSILLIRGIKERKHEAFSAMKVVQVVFVAVIVGSLWWQCDPLDQVGLLFFASSFWGFFPLIQAIFTFPKEGLILKKEISSGMYRLSTYYISRTIADLPMELVLPTLYVVITYLMAGLKLNGRSFFGTLFGQLLSVLVSQGMGLALGAVVMDEKSASTLGSVIMLAFVLAGGYYVPKMPKFIAWIKYFSVSQYTYKLFLISQYKANDNYPCQNNNNNNNNGNYGGLICKVGDFPAIKRVGLDGKGITILALVLMLIGYRLIAYFALMRIGVTN